jgi:hypothetical protein
VTGAVVDGELRVEWGYTPNRHHGATVERLARDFVDELRRLAEHCAGPRAGGLTPSDFPHAGLSRQALDALLPQLGQRPAGQAARGEGRAPCARTSEAPHQADGARTWINPNREEP